MNFQGLGETKGFSGLSSVLPPLRSVVSLHKRGINCCTGGRSKQIGGQQCQCSENKTSYDLYYPSLLSSFPNRPVDQFWRHHQHRLGISPRSRFPGKGDFFGVGLFNRFFIRGMFVAGEQYVWSPIRSLLDILDQFYTVSCSSFSWNETDQKPAFGINGGMVPQITLQGIRFNLLFQHLFFLSDERPPFVELNLFRQRGKKKPTHHEVLWRAHHSSEHIASRYPYSTQAGGSWLGFRTPPGYGRAGRELFLGGGGIPIELSPSARRTELHKSCIGPFESPSRFHSSRKTSSSLCHASQRPGNPCFDNRTYRLNAHQMPLSSFPPGKNGSWYLNQGGKYTKFSYFRTPPGFQFGQIWAN